MKNSFKKNCLYGPIFGRGLIFGMLIGLHIGGRIFGGEGLIYGAGRISSILRYTRNFSVS